jgi:hypothetical protein
MRVLVACEFSGVVRDAFRKRGHEAWSCDLLPTEIPGPHMRCDVRGVLWSQLWDLMIAHPPCTFLARAGARWWKGKEREQEEALIFFRELLAAPIPHICVENPPGKVGTAIRPADQYIQPWQHGHGEVKMTGLWLVGLPLLVPSRIVKGREPRVHRCAPSPDRWKERSRTLPGIATAMAAQWGRLVSSGAV